MNSLGINKDNLHRVQEHLNTLLSSYAVYNQNLLSFHWHIRGISFFDLHQQFENFYIDARIKIDEIAERILTLDFKPLGSFSEYLSNSLISEAQDLLEDKLMANTILENQLVLLRIMRTLLEEASSAKDEGTVDMIGGFIRELEKQNWLLRTWLSKAKLKAPALN